MKDFVFQNVHKNFAMNGLGDFPQEDRYKTWMDNFWINIVFWSRHILNIIFCFIRYIESFHRGTEMSECWLGILVKIINCKKQQTGNSILLEIYEFLWKNGWCWSTEFCSFIKWITFRVICVLWDGKHKKLI